MYDYAVPEATVDPRDPLLKGSDNYLSGLVRYRVFLYRVHHNLDVCLEAARSSWSIQRS